LIIAHLIYLVILPFWLFARTHVRYDFCSPGSENLFWLIYLFYFILANPVGVVIAPAGGWLFYKWNKRCLTYV
jgi:hypothetical protein